MCLGLLGFVTVVGLSVIGRPKEALVIATRLQIIHILVFACQVFLRLSDAFKW